MSQKRYAYLIGANGPEGMRLKHAERDVTRLADALKGPYCQFTRTEVVIAQSRKDGLKGFKDFAEQRDPSDLLLVHFSGHAFFDEELYLLCNDTDIQDLYSTALEVRTIKTIMSRSRARHKVLILDCCHAAGAHGNALKGEQDIRGMLHQTMQGSASVILSACSRKERTRELDELDGGSGFLSWSIRAGCTTHFHEASSSPDLNVLSLDDLWRRWIPKALEYVNRLPSISKPLPPPILLSELESGYGSEIWLTDPPSSVRDIRTSSDEMRRKYLEQVYKRYSSVTLPIGPTEGFSLQAIFQPLALRRDPLAAGDLERKQRRMFLDEAHGDDDEYPHASSAPLRKERSGAADQPAPLVIAENGETALAKSPQGRMVVLGGPGTGKTTTLKYLISCRAKDALANSTLPVPIFLSLADLARKTLQSCLIDVVEDMSVERSYADALWKAIESGHAFVVLDGLDEVDPAQRARMIELVNRRASEPGNTWLIGSRFTEYKGGQFKRGQFAEWELLPMSPQLRQDLAAKLFPELQCLLSLPSMNSLSPSTFVSLLENHPHAAAWGENPLLFSLAAVVFVETGGLPPSRATLYRDVIEAVLAMREQDTDGRTHLLRTLTGLALWLYKRRTRTFTNDDLFTFLEDIQHRSWEEAEKIAKRIIASGVLDLIAPNTYGFRHPTFQEYLAAVELAKWLTSHDPAARKEAWKFVWDRHIYSRWTEVLRLMVGVLAQLPGKKGRSTAVRWLHQLVEQRSTEEGDPGDLGLELALKSLVEVTEVAEWETVKTAQLEKHVVSIWIDELLEVARNQRQTRVERFNSLVKDVVHLRKCGREAVVGRWLRALKDRDEDVRDIAREMLEVLGTWVPLDRLLAMLEDPDWNVRRAAVQALGQQGERVPLDRLLAMLEDPDEDVRQAAVQALGQQGERVPLDRLLAMLEDPDRFVRQAAVQALGQQGERVPLDRLLAMLEDPDWNVRRAAVQALGQQGERVPLDRLLAMLEDPDWNVRRAAVQALGQQGERVPLDRLLAMLENPDEDVRRAAVQALGQQGERVPLDRLLAMLENPDEDVRRAAVQVVGQQGERVPLDRLLAMLENPDWFVRRAAVQVVGQQGERVPLDRLLAMLEDPDEDVRQAAVQALGQQGERVPLDRLLAMLENPDWNVRRAAVQALGQQGERVPLDRLLAMLEDPDEDVRQAAVQALGQQGERVPLDRLLAMLENPDWNVRRAAVQALGQQGERVPLDRLLAMLEDPDEDVRQAAVQALGQQGERVPLDRLLAMLENPDWFVRRAAVQVVGQQGERVPLDRLLAMLEDPDRFVRRAAVQALGQQGERVSIDALLPFFYDKDADIRLAALEVLETLSERVPLEPLIELLSDEDGNVREIAVRILKKVAPDVLSDLLPQAMSVLQGKVVGNVFASLVQMSVADTIGTMGLTSLKLLEKLTELLDWPYWQVRLKATQALGQLRRNIPDTAIRRLLQLRRDPDPKMRAVREAADDALAEILSLETGIEDE